MVLLTHPPKWRDLDLGTSVSVEIWKFSPNNPEAKTSPLSKPRAALKSPVTRVPTANIKSHISPHPSSMPKSVPTAEAGKSLDGRWAVRGGDEGGLSHDIGAALKHPRDCFGFDTRLDEKPKDCPVRPNIGLSAADPAKNHWRNEIKALERAHQYKERACSDLDWNKKTWKAGDEEPVYKTGCATHSEYRDNDRQAAATQIFQDSRH